MSKLICHRRSQHEICDTALWILVALFCKGISSLYFAMDLYKSLWSIAYNTTWGLPLLSLQSPPKRFAPQKIKNKSVTRCTFLWQICNRCHTFRNGSVVINVHYLTHSILKHVSKAADSILIIGLADCNEQIVILLNVAKMSLKPHRYT